MCATRRRSSSRENGEKQVARPAFSRASNRFNTESAAEMNLFQTSSRRNRLADIFIGILRGNSVCLHAQTGDRVRRTQINTPIPSTATSISRKSTRSTAIIYFARRAKERRKKKKKKENSGQGWASGWYWWRKKKENLATRWNFLRVVASRTRRSNEISSRASMCVIVTSIIGHVWHWKRVKMIVGAISSENENGAMYTFIITARDDRYNGNYDSLINTFMK